MSTNDPTPFHGTPFQSLMEFLESSGLNFTRNVECRNAWFHINGGTAILRCHFEMDDAEHLLQISIRVPLMVCEAFRPAAAEYLTRANYGLHLGAFQFDMNDGEVRYHLSHVIEKEISPQTIGGLFKSSMSLCERYLPGLMQVLYAGITPEDAVHLVELDLHAHALPEDPAPAEGSLPSRSKRGKGTTASPSEPATPTALRTLRNHGPRGRVNGGRRSTPPRKRDGDERQGH
jgi:hypothetical protein